MEKFLVFSIGSISDDILKTSKIYEQIQPMITSIRTYNTFKECEADLYAATDEKLILIIKFDLAKEIVPIIHDLQKIITIYIYSPDQNKSEAWMNNFSKVNICLFFI